MLGRRKKADLDTIISNHEESEARMNREASGDNVLQSREQIGTVEQFFDRLMVAAVRLTGNLEVGDIIEIGTEDDAVRQRVTSMQINRKDVDSASSGDDVGIKMKYAVSPGSAVYRL